MLEQTNAVGTLLERPRAVPAATVSGPLVAQCPCGSSRPCGNARAPGTALDTRGRQWNTSSVCSGASARGQVAK